MSENILIAPNEQVVRLQWFEFDQNNSGGRYVSDDHVASRVWIQATSAEAACERMESILELTDTSYCPCCGERWYVGPWGMEGHDEPMWWMWRPNGRGMTVPLRLAFREPGAGYLGIDVMFYAYDGRKVKYVIPEADGSPEHQARISGLKALGFDV
jgi:hypothetical protein